MEDRGQVVIPVRHTTQGPGKSESSGRGLFGHKDSILVGLGLLLFLSVIWVLFVHRMYLNIETVDSGSSVEDVAAAIDAGTAAKGV
ncbi:hypothetical protein HYH03_000152 [Edaphochlamys debaryana]|uniref:Uncharacterized protein n=1 Tax=Edaphochlamys debaryana TaxID=47281 RepID=A0A835YFB1_9CHLO|nr:hypothetical protein HYH03_000152 [Edaphochlamys debaryana]|eukprot:KAG2501648.1 hypothetical protein HYH03_000152 [Edaphochlamys debaryana]